VASGAGCGAGGRTWHEQTWRHRALAHGGGDKSASDNNNGGAIYQQHGTPSNASTLIGVVAAPVGTTKIATNRAWRRDKLGCKTSSTSGSLAIAAFIGVKWRTRGRVGGVDMVYYGRASVVIMAPRGARNIGACSARIARA